MSSSCQSPMVQIGRPHRQLGVCPTPWALLWLHRLLLFFALSAGSTVRAAVFQALESFQGLPVPQGLCLSSLPILASAYLLAAYLFITTIRCFRRAQ